MYHYVSGSGCSVATVNNVVVSAHSISELNVFVETCLIEVISRVVYTTGATSYQAMFISYVLSVTSHG